ncbi:hypothetical protein [Allostreptomyces psammosilenae]|uniref:Peptidoglycan/LPS O-acetylase OafA/YrhL n=1 Tax=Allostreptomyces psammosilenae TaxID=1892865 RepID=A0A852ZUQ6_9ACTN|nr:hypothetical protein [Allostreptomyces psammosilenae]NYI05010.1 peptidoglycan/LPS O-acetylase OafA/YrhL [Allostreptomyces psammosilenae]
MMGTQGQTATRTTTATGSAAPPRWPAVAAAVAVFALGVLVAESGRRSGGIMLVLPFVPAVVGGAMAFYALARVRGWRARQRGQLRVLAAIAMLQVPAVVGFYSWLTYYLYGA